MEGGIGVFPLTVGAMEEIIADIYHAAAGTKPWSDVLTRITQKLELKGSQAVGVCTGNGAVLFSHASADVPTETELEYVRTYHCVDPRIPLLLKSTTGDWLYDQDVFDASMATTSPYYRDLLIPYGARYSASTKLFDRDGEVVLIAFLSHLGMPGFSAQHREVLRSLTFHLREAATIYQQTRKLTTAAFAGTELLHRMPRPALLLGTDRGVTFMNERARHFLAGNNALLLSRDRLTALDKWTNDELAMAFQTIVRDISQGGAPKRHIIRLASSHGKATAALSLTAFVPSQSMYAFGTQAQVLVLIHESSSHLAPDILLWEAAFNLTPAQSRVALEIFQGRSTKEAAQSLKIAQTTVKSHLKEVYWKTDTARQSQLISALASLQST